ncbi:WD40 repeat domain-containing protein [Micromonospora sp. HUAS LYJ1]|uniref:WD40 repeat domain-containing protein n=1 Tax=Micromonospora sp. HUAS LYJ1 TaxID=3061626 RepID=UPI00267300A4|nr:AAA family ATPase [Micromonospora sp. HUAS LYJ1]WKU03439.1 AAA family ATPase [Micromonospora sp. HUAS LYJ1]
MEKHEELHRSAGVQGIARHRPAGWIMAGVEARDHFLRRSRGQHSGIAIADLFHGRGLAVRHARGFLTAAQSQGKPLVVTGDPGAGKSALLARVVLDLEAEHASSGVAIHGHGITRTEVLTAIGSLAGLPAVHDEGQLLRALAGTDGPLLIIAVDALDEAASSAERRSIAALLVTLARIQRIRVMVATRALARDDRFGVGSLLRCLGVDAPDCGNLIDLDTDAYFDLAGLRAFAASVLTTDLPGGVRAVYRADPALTERLAAAIAARAARNYLVAALAAAALGDRATTVDPAHREFDPRTIPSTIGEALTKYLDTLPEDRQVLTEVLLRALAYARGTGVDDHRWVRFADVLGYTGISRTEIDSLRRSPGSAYLLQSRPEGDGRLTTRVFHQALADELLPQLGDRREDERALLATLIPSPTDGWLSADAYSRAHAAEHAWAAGQLDLLLNDPYFLAAADLTRLLPLLPPNPAAAVTSAVTVLRQATDAASCEPKRRARLLALSAAHLGFSDLQAGLASVNNLDVYRIGWAHCLGTPHQVLVGHTGEAVRVAVGHFDGRVVVVSGDGDGIIQVHDAASATLLAQLPSHPGGVHGIAVAPQTVDGVIATGGADGLVRIHRSLTGGSTVIDIGSCVNAVGLTRTDNREVVVIAANDGLFLHDARSGQRVYHATEAGLRVQGVAVGRVAGGRMIACIGGDGVALLDLRSGTLIRQLPGPTEEGLDAISFFHIDGRDFILASGMGAAVVSDAATGELVHQLPVSSMTTAVAALDSQVIILAADTDGDIAMLDARTGEFAGALLGHTDMVTSLAVGVVGGRNVVVSGSLDAMVRVHDISAEALTAANDLTSHGGKVEEVVAGLIQGRSVVVSNDQSGVRIYDAETGEPTGPALTNIKSHRNITLGQVADRDILVCGGYGGNLQVFDAATHELLHDWSDATWRCVTALGIGTAGGRVILAVGANDDSVRVLDARSGQQITKIPVSVRHLALGRAECPDFVVVVSNDNACRVFDPITGEKISDLTDITGPLWATATATLKGRPVVATAGCNGSVSLIDPITGIVLDELPDHRDDVTTVATTYEDDGLVVVTGGRDATVQVTAVSDGEPFVVDVVDVVNAVTTLDGRIFVASGNSIFNLTACDAPHEERALVMETGAAGKR